MWLWGAVGPYRRREMERCLKHREQDGSSSSSGPPLGSKHRINSARDLAAESQQAQVSCPCRGSGWSFRLWGRQASSVRGGGRAWAGVWKRPESAPFVLCCGTGRELIIVKLLLGFTRSYPSTVQGARGLVGQLALVLDSN